MKEILMTLAILASTPGFSAPEPIASPVVINEIFYHSPGDLSALEFVEIHNPGTNVVDLSGWKLSDDIEYSFVKGASIGAGAYLVVSRDAKLLEEFYGMKGHGVFEGSLGNSGGRLTLSNARGETIDSIAFDDRTPWPLAADGHSASLERICPTNSTRNVTNWAPSLLSNDTASKPSGTPGKKNTTFSSTFPPTIRDVTVTPAICVPGESITVEATIEQSLSKLGEIEVLYRVVAPGNEGEEISVHMKPKPGTKGRYSATVPGSEARRIIRLRVRANDEAGGRRVFPADNELRPALSVWVKGETGDAAIPIVEFFNVGKDEFTKAKAARESQGRGDSRSRGRFGRGRFGRGFGGRGFSGRGAAPVPARGRAAFIFTDPATKKTKLFDFIHISERKSGYKIRLHRDRKLDGMSTLNILYEYDERSILNEALAYEVYRLAGNSTPKSGYMRVIIDGDTIGYHLFFEQPNGNFLRRSNINSRGDLYKILWQGSNRPSQRTPPEKIPERRDIIGRHEKMTNPHTGYVDLVGFIESLEKSEDPDALWEQIQKTVDVEQVTNYFAANMLISHWDGFFNNYFLYHDVKGSGKWMMFPWDQDSTWSHRMARNGEVFAEMPLIFGMEGAVPPGTDGSPDSDRGRRGRFGGRGFGFGRGGGPSWWRPGGEVSKPFLANPECRRQFLARLEVLADTVYTEKVFGPKLDAMRTQLEPEVRLRAKIRGRDEDDAARELERTLSFFREHLVKRRAYILSSME